ncbi:hypothetical protein HOA92_03330 [archaeon]|jgi:fructose-1,6-bisphosphatase/inositol monophosphatase family enzyme|nr:hypothetical protein [archaeon]MBT6762046.1 hypothetical protein [archaeon]
MVFHYNPAKIRHNDALQYFAEHQDKFPGLTPSIELFSNQQSLGTAKAMLTNYFAHHQQGDTRSLRVITSMFADKRVALNIVDSILSDEAALEQIASTSYPHPIGFDKLVLHHHNPRTEDEQRYKLRLHIYWRTPQEAAAEKIHLHRFEMASSPITGELTNILYRVKEFSEAEAVDGLTRNLGLPLPIAINPKDGLDAKEMHAYSGYLRDRDGVLHKQFMGTAKLQRLGALTFVPGQTYVQGLQFPHYVETNAETGHTNNDVCSTFYIHGPNLIDNAGRRIPVLFEPERLAEDDQIINTISNITPKDLKESLLKYRSLLSESLNFYEWLYDPKYGRDLSTGLVSGHLLTEILGDKEVVAAWRKHQPACVELLTQRSAALESIILDGRSIGSLDHDKKETRYFQQLINKAYSHSGGPKVWLKESGNLAHEFDRYVGALVGDYVRNSNEGDIRVLKPIWKLGTTSPRQGAHYGNIAVMLEAARAVWDIPLKKFRSGQMQDISVPDHFGPKIQEDEDVHMGIVSIIQRHFPLAEIISEEGQINLSQKDPVNGQTRWKVDPLDGSRNALHGNDQFAISIAHELYDGNNWVTTDAVVAKPVQKEIYWAELDQGAYFIDASGKETKLKIQSASGGSDQHSICDTLDGKLVDVSLRGLGDSRWQLMQNLEDGSNARIRATGSAALMFSYLAGHGNDAVMVTANHYDVAAGILIAEEAGAHINRSSFHRDIAGKQREFTLYFGAQTQTVKKELEDLIAATLTQMQG